MIVTDVLNNFAEALYDKVNLLTGGAHSDYWEAIQGRFFKGRAPQGTTFPYSIYRVVSHIPHRTFNSDHRELGVQFSHYSIASSPEEVEQINFYCNSLFDEKASFPITGASLEWMKMTNSQGLRVLSRSPLIFSNNPKYRMLFSGVRLGF